MDPQPFSQGWHPSACGGGGDRGGGRASLLPSPTLRSQTGCRDGPRGATPPGIRAPPPLPSPPRSSTPLPVGVPALSLWWPSSGSPLPRTTLSCPVASVPSRHRPPVPGSVTLSGAPATPWNCPVPLGPQTRGTETSASGSLRPALTLPPRCGNSLPLPEAGVAGAPTKPDASNPRPRPHPP